MQEILKKIEQEIAKRNISEDEIAEILQSIKHFTNRRIIGGYASVSIIDREGQKIPVEALKDAVRDFMEDIHYRNVNIFHSDVTCGRILPRWTNPEIGQTYETRVDNKGWYVIAEIRDDLEIADKIWSEIEKGNIKSFSIAGSSKAKKDMYEAGKPFQAVMKLEIYECTCCEIPVCQMAMFDILWNPQKVSI